MMTRLSEHLNEDLLIRMVIDPDDLPQWVHRHLDECALCQADKAQFEQELVTFGHLVKTFVPETSHKPVRREQVAERFVHLRFFSMGWLRWGLASGFAIVFLIGAFFWLIPMKSSTDLINIPTLTEIMNDPPLVADIIPSEETDLTETIKQVGYDANGYLEDEFVDFVAPFDFDRNSV